MRPFSIRQKGFSIVQVMVAMGLAGGLALVILQLSSNMNQVQLTAESFQEETELKLELRMLLDNSLHCTASFGGVEPSIPPLKFKKRNIDEPDSEGLNVELYQAQLNANGEVVGRTKRFTGNPNDTTPTLVKNRKIKIKSMKLTMPNPPINTNYPQADRHTDLARLIVVIEKNKREKRIDLPLVVTMKTDNNGNSTILECRSQPEADPCPPLGMVLDMNTGLCRPRKTQATGHTAYAGYSGGFWGSWGGWDMCGDSRLVCGIQTKVEGSQGGGDDTALNAVRLICCQNLPIGRQNIQGITSKQGGWGSWGGEEYCPTGSYARGYRQKLEGKQGGGDDTATNAVEIVCSDPSKTKLTSTQAGWGNWRAYGYCPNEQYICGLRTRVENSQGGGDDTAFNGLEVRCCKFIE